ncbi:Phosducin-like protein 3 [Phlyctochytrium bullatum]|nr:Phosducin-like protein 3 [Phlyctochytrium bullatum]
MSHLEDTEWNDALRAQGILPPKEVEITEDAIEEMVDKVIKEKYGGKTLEDRTLDELDELEDDEDDRVLEEYRRKRMAELASIAAREKFGEVVHISKPEYKEEVTEASKTDWVVVYLYQPTLPNCKLISAHLDTLARKHKATKFVKIVGNQCIPNYPDHNCPTLLIYGPKNGEGDLRANLVGIDMMGGPNVKAAGLELVLAMHGAVDVKEEDRKEAENEYVSSIRVSRPSKHQEVADDDWD